MRFGHLDPHLGVRLLRQMESAGVTRLALTPSALKEIGVATRRVEADVRKVKRLVTGGAPVPRWLVEKAARAFPHSENFVVYGSTEAEPISYVSFDEILSESTQGYLVGRPVPEIQLKFERGEIYLHGPHVIPRYLFHEEDNRSTKIRDESGRLWHRTRDLGHLDAKGRVWLTGRVSDRVNVAGQWQDVFPIEHGLENLTEARVALIQSRNERLILFTEKDPRLLEPGSQKDFAEQVGRIKADVRVMGRLPTDRRHLWKINRHRLGGRSVGELDLP
jgi:acyl-CoA synthetase (AMP-forming)/AMP-acid ligase II